MAKETRQLTFLLAEPERRLLTFMAARIPQPVNSNHLTFIGVVGAVGCGLGYALSTLDFRWLWFASLMMAVNWFGDSLDGTLARVRRAERPRYGYYLDHIVDAFSTAAIGIGVGLSPFVALPLALAAVVLYLTLSINVYLESHVFGVFKLGYGRIGPTEARIILIVANTLLLTFAERPSTQPHILWLSANAVVLAMVVSMLATIAVRFGKNLHKLAKLEPRRRAATKCQESGI